MFKRLWFVFGVVIILLLLISFISLSVGRYHLGIYDVINIFAHNNAQNNQVWQVIFGLRMPRLLAGLLVGMALSVAGSVYQVMFRNPLVSPDILGVSAGAGFGACIAIFLGFSIIGIELTAFLCGLLAVFLVYFISAYLRQLDPILVLILMGVVISSIFGALISLIKIMADPYTQLSTITFWLMGGLNTIQYHELMYTAPFIFIALTPIILLRWKINLLNLSDDESKSLGLNPAMLRIILIFAATLMTSSVVAISGMIGWVGLIIPHIARLIVGHKFSSVLLLSMILGPIFLVISDTFSRIVAPIDLPLSILTAFIGAPFFIFILLNRDRRSLK